MKHHPRDPFVDKLIQVAINHNPTLGEQLAAITEAHHERLADLSQGRPYFRVDDLVKHLRTFSYGTVQQVRPHGYNYFYLIAWFNSPSAHQWQWVEADSLTLSYSLV